MSLRTRLVLGVLVLAALALVAADIATYTSLRSFLMRRADRTLVADAHAVEEALRPGPGGDLRGSLGTPPGVYVQVRSAAGVVLFTATNRPFRGVAPSPPRLPKKVSLPTGPEAGPDGDRFFSVPAVEGGLRYRVHASVDPVSGNQLLVAEPLRDVDATLHRLFLIELLVTAAVLSAIVLVGLWIVRLGLRPLQAIERTAADIVAGDLSHRVERAEERTEVGRLGLALNAMLEHIEASDRRLRRFVADASHELRTPLAAVRAYAELFSRGADRRPDDLARAMSGIERESERMSVLVEDLLLLARLDEGRPLERKPVELDRLAGEAVDTARTVEPDRPIDLTAEPVVVLGDRDRLRQVLDNLLGNVRSHTPAATPAHVRVMSANGHAVVEVEDEGPGIAEEEAARVFERFYRTDASRSRRSGGVGLGLSIVAAVTHAHAGTVSAHSAPGRGTTFRITLPQYR